MPWKIQIIKSNPETFADLVEALHEIRHNPFSAIGINIANAMICEWYRCKSLSQNIIWF